VTTGYNPNNGTSECAPGLQGMPVNHPAAIIYIYPNPWPPPAATFPMAPQEPVSGQDSWCVFNDCDSIYHNPGDTRPIGIEAYQTVYAWNRPGVEDMIFFLHEVKNVTDYTLQQCYIGIAVHCQIGYSDPNDRCCAIIERRYAISGDTIDVDNVGYQWQEDEEPGTPPWFPGVIGFDLLQTPFDLVEGMDKDGDGILDQYERDSAYYVNNLPQYLWDADNDGVPDWRDPSQWPQLGMTAFKRYSFPCPDTDAERFLTMAGYDFLTGQYEPFDTIPPAPSDWWILVESSGPFDLLPDSTVTMIFGVMCADWHDLFEWPDTALVLVDQRAEDYYNVYWHLYTGIEENFEFRTSNFGLRIVPNPVIHSTNIVFSLSTPDHISLDLYNSVGQHVMKIMEGYRAACDHNIFIDTRKLPQGTYFLSLETSKKREYRTIVVLRQQSLIRGFE